MLGAVIILLPHFKIHGQSPTLVRLFTCAIDGVIMFQVQKMKTLATVPLMTILQTHRHHNHLRIRLLSM